MNDLKDFPLFIAAAAIKIAGAIDDGQINISSQEGELAIAKIIYNEYKEQKESELW